MKTPDSVPAMITQVRGHAIRPSLKHRHTRLVIAAKLKTKFVEVAAGLLKTRWLI
jgi:hypothetical protein